MDVGEYLAESAAREVKEETGLDVEVVGIVGIYTDPRHVIAYDDGGKRGLPDDIEHPLQSFCRLVWP
jgi:8-oxo-dGTP pyrophosphatase MutT (NUDIX family)